MAKKRKDHSSEKSRNRTTDIDQSDTAVLELNLIIMTMIWTIGCIGVTAWLSANTESLDLKIGGYAVAAMTIATLVMFGITRKWRFSGLDRIEKCTDLTWIKEFHS